MEKSSAHDTLTTQGYTHFSLGLDNNQRETLDAINVDHSHIYDNFGTLDQLRSDVFRELCDQGNTPQQAITQSGILNKIVQDCVQGFGSESAWVSVRFSKPNDRFSTPRWHMDGNYFEDDYGSNQRIKALMTVKGASTLLSDADIIQRNLLDGFHNKASPPSDIARALSVHLVGTSGISQTPDGYGTLIVAGEGIKAVHSEPDITEDRVFISVLPGTKAQIRGLQERWHLETLNDKQPAAMAR